MREIKFRGKEVETGKWVYGKLIENKNKGKGLLSGYHYIVPFDIIPYAGNNEHTMIEGGYPNYSDDDYSRCWKEREAVTISVIRVDNDTIGQYTGLKDKNGKEIYEGDIVRIDCPTMQLTGSIRYSEISAMFYIYDVIEDIEETLWYQEEEYEVIGNIYDNIKLLGE